MAEAFFKVLIDNVTFLIKSEVGLIMGVDKEMKKLSNTLTTIQKVLEDAEDRQFHDRSIQFWLSQLNDMAFEIEDILDECNTEFSKLKAKGNNFVNKLKKVLFKSKVGRRIKKATEKLEAVAKDRHNFQLTERVVQQLNQRDWRRETGSVLNDPDHVYGRDEDREKIVDMLVNRVCEQSLSVLPIIGMGGMGKTTLAQFIFNDDRVTQHFNAKLWVCVSDNYNLIAILKAMIESVAGSKPNLDNLDSLQRRLCHELNAKRYLLVLDDVWNDNPEDWDTLKGTVACGSMGSSIVVTTRLQKVADITGTLPSHCLTELSEEHCWLLLRRRAFGQENEQPHGNFESIGRRIVKKCGGVPLAAKALGGLLRFQRDENEWVRVEESHIWNLPQEENSILPVLRLSYRHLPFVMKRCFSYCAVFPKDHKFDKSKLIFHWMAHGCIVASNGKREVEDVGNQIWNELALRSFFQEVNTTSEGKITFKIHDLVHDLAQSIMENKIPGAKTENGSTSASNNKIREVHWCKQYNSKIISSNIAVELSTLATIMNYNRLRILKLKWIDVEELPSAIGKLKQLRCLNLSHSSILTLPHTFYCLYNLQILILNYCRGLKSLPKNIRSMTNLRHIFLKECEGLSHMPYRIGELASLKTLSLFIVGDKIGNQLDELEHLSLGGSLEIRNIKSVKSHLTAKRANLVEKPNLRELVLRWEGDGTSSELMENERVFEALQPHPNLVTLEIYGFRGRQLALWMKSMKNITRIYVRGCTNLRSLSPIGDLPHLKSLKLNDLEALEYILEENEVGCEATKFPSLEKLSLGLLPNLKGWLKEGEVVEMFPNLQDLVISECESLRLTSTSRGLNSLTNLELRFCEIGNCFPEGSLWQLTALQNLEIWFCTELEDNMAEEMKHLHLLKHLTLFGVDDMVSLPQALQHIPSLQSLTLRYLHQLTSLPDWLPNLVSLTQLEITCCPAIQSLPSSIQRMTNLKVLTIWRCPQLKSRCEEPNGEDWHNISHIPHLDIQYSYT